MHGFYIFLILSFSIFCLSPHLYFLYSLFLGSFGIFTPIFNLVDLTTSIIFIHYKYVLVILIVTTLAISVKEIKKWGVLGAGLPMPRIN
jgi:hypothetical protein